MNTVAKVSCALVCLAGVWLPGSLLAQATPTPPSVAPSMQVSSAPSGQNATDATGAQGAHGTLANDLTGSAKANYDAAFLLFDDADYAGALVKFQHAYGDSGDPRLLWNMAVCEKNLRHYANVQRLLSRYLRDGQQTMTPEHRAEVSEVLDVVRSLVSQVQVLVDQPGAQVFVDEELIGTTPLSEAVPLTLGRHRVRVSKAGYVDHALVQEFGGGSEVSLQIALKREDLRGWLAVSADEKDAIAIDGARVAYAHWQGYLPAGAHTVRVTASGKKPYDKAIELRAKDNQHLSVTLERERSGRQALLWVGAGVLAAGGLAVGSYFLFLKPEDKGSGVVVGTFSPGTIQVP